MATYWHLADPSWQPGQDLICRNDQTVKAPWKWSTDVNPSACAEEGWDGEFVCLFGRPDRLALDLQDMEWMHSDYPHLIRLRVEIPEEYEHLIEYCSEGYAAIRGRIPAEWITVESEGYQPELECERCHRVGHDVTIADGDTLCPECRDYYDRMWSA